MADQFPVGAESLLEPIARQSLEEVASRKFYTGMTDQFPVGAESPILPNAADFGGGGRSYVPYVDG